MSSTSRHGLAAAPTGPELGMRLALIEPRAATDEELLDLLAAETRQLAYQQARTWAVLAELATRDPMPNLAAATAWTPEQIFDSAVDELRAELRLTRRSARRELARADTVAGVPRVMQALLTGAIDRTRAIVLSEGCLDLTDEQRTVLLDSVLPNAGRVTATQLAEQVRRVAIALDPAWAERRYKQAVRERAVVGYLNDDGSATVSGQYLPAEQAAAACARVDALADAAKRAGAAAKTDHLRAELFLGLLDGRFHGMSESAIVVELVTLFPKAAEAREAEPAQPADHAGESGTEEQTRPEPADTGSDAGTERGVHLRVGFGTLLGLDEQPGEIAGWGPVTAPVARRIAARQRRSEWRYAIVDEHGRVAFDGVTRRRPRNADTKAQPAPGGIVELHVAAGLLDDPQLRERCSDWAGVLADLLEQSARAAAIEQDTAARFAGRPLRRRVQTTFQRCIFPGCRRPASDCDLDHRRDHVRGGLTDEDNLAPGCRHDHMNKTARGWRLVRRDDITYVWISPLGRKHVVTVEPVAPPLPAPRPREFRPGPEIVEVESGKPEPTFSRRTRRGRPMVSVVDRATVAECDPDPPPF